MEDKKRSREEIETFDADAKRFRPDIILEILDSDDDDADSGDRTGTAGDVESDDLASVMKSLEDEIALPSQLPPPPPAQLPSELGYLLEASDDELGLPPAMASSASSSSLQEGEEEEEEEASGAGSAVAVAEELGFGGQIWGFEDEIVSGCYDELGFGGVPCYDVDGSGSVGEDDVLFYGDDVAVFGLSEFSWPAESLPTV